MSDWHVHLVPLGSMALALAYITVLFWRACGI